MNIASYIDHTNLKATATEADIRTLCEQAIQYKFATVCVNPRWVPLVASLVEAKSPKVCSVAGFPLGAEFPQIKAIQAEHAIMAGADEIDIVADLPSIIALDERALINDISPVLKVCRKFRPAVTLKVIIESAALTDDQIIMASQVCSRVGVDYVKTSTGLNPAGGASIEAVKLMKENAPNCRVKAAGGIRTKQQAIEYINAGVSRIGCSASVEVVKGSMY